MIIRLLSCCLLAALAGCAGSQSTPNAPLRGTHWTLVNLGDTAIRPGDTQREPYLLLSTTDSRVTGTGGCNGAGSTYELDGGDRLKLGRGFSTMMACPKGMDIEQRFLRSLETVAAYRIKGSSLELLDAKGGTVARFEARK